MGDIPGVKKDDVNVQVTTEAAKRKYLVIEGKRGSVSFSRRIRLDDTVLAEKVLANLCDGVLSISAAKKEKPAPIVISISQGEQVVTEVGTPKNDSKKDEEEEEHGEEEKMAPSAQMEFEEFIAVPTEKMV